MPKSYTEKEKAVILEELKKAAMESMIQKGVKKTTVDELVAKVHIPKGTFYLFYPSKEMLLYDAFLQMDEATHRQLSKAIEELPKDLTPDMLTELLYQFFQMGFQMGIFPLMTSGELDILMRKLPDEVVAEHIAKDDDFLLVFRLLFPEMEDNSIQEYSAAFRAVFFTAAYQREIGDHFDAALKLLIRGLVLQMWEESKRD